MYDGENDVHVWAKMKRLWSVYDWKSQVMYGLYEEWDILINYDITYAFILYYL